MRPEPSPAGGRGNLKDMNWTYLLIGFAIIVAFFLLKLAGQVSSKAAAQYLKEGALVIDVRSAAEFKSSHLPQAINMPLGEIAAQLPRRVKDKTQVILLHCQSGARSGMAKKMLNNLGYTNAFNLGSYSRAAKIVSSK